MKTYKEVTLNESISKLMQQLNKKFSNKITFAKAVWKDIAPAWALDLIPYLIKNDTLFFKTKKNAIILQYREKEILSIVKLIFADEISKIKILSD